MIEYIVPQNIDTRVLERIKEHLNDGGLIALPSDTNWIVCACPYKSKAVDALYSLKGESKSHHFSLICHNISQASEYAYIPDYAFRLIRSRLPGNFTFIFQASKVASKLLKASKTDKEVGIRIPPINYLLDLINYLEYPLLNTNIKPEMMGLSDPSEIYGLLIDEHFPHVGLVIDPGEYQFVGASTIYRLIDEEVELVREGVGDLI